MNQEQREQWKGSLKTEGERSHPGNRTDESHSEEIKLLR